MKYRFLSFALFLLFMSLGGFAHASGQWKLSSEKSRLDFFVKSTLHDFKGTARKLTGTLNQNKNLVTGFVDVDIAGLTTNEPDRDKNMYQMFDVTLSPVIHFSFNDTDLKVIQDHQQGELRFNGVMSIHHFSRPVNIQSRGRMANNTLICEGEILIHLKDFGLKPPSILGFIRVNDEVAVQYSIVFINS